MWHEVEKETTVSLYFSFTVLSYYISVGEGGEKMRKCGKLKHTELVLWVLSAVTVVIM